MLNKRIGILVLSSVLSMGMLVGCNNNNIDNQIQEERIVEENNNSHKIENEDAYNKGYSYWRANTDEDYLVQIYSFTANMRYRYDDIDLDVVQWNEDNPIEPYTIKAEDVDDYCWGQLHFLIDEVKKHDDEEVLEFLEEIEINFDKNNWDYYENKAAEMYQNRIEIKRETTQKQQKEVQEETIQEKNKSKVVSTEQKQALKKAEQYLDLMGFSKEGLRKQLAYDGFEDESIDYALENVDVDWNEEALEKAEQYMDLMGFSKEGMRNQLKYDGFEDNEIEYAINKLY